MIPRKIHQIWLGGKMPTNIEKCVDSVISACHDIEYTMWDENKVRLLLGVQDEDLIGYLKNEYNTIASATNYIRLVIVSRFGGIYLDTDCECVSSMDKLFAYNEFAAFQDSIKHNDSDGRICNAVFGAHQNSKWIRWQIDNKERYCVKDAAWGVYAMTDAPREGLSIVPTEWVYPWVYDTPKENRNAHRDTIIIHHWEGSWTK